MIEIDHAAQEKVSYSPETAQRITADQLLELEERQRTQFGGKAGGLARIKTGCQEIDNYVLCAGKDEPNGGFERGIVVGLSAADGDESVGSRLISLNLIASVLLQHMDSVDANKNLPNGSSNTMKPKIVVIDTAGSFSLPLLVKVLRSRLLNSRYETKSSKNDTTEEFEHTHNPDEDANIEIQKDVNAMLELVAISRVFDIEGLWEVLGEIGRTDPQHNTENDQEISTRQSQKGKSIEKQTSPLHKLPEEIGDSEEDEDIEITPPPNKPTTSHTDSVEAPEILIIDNMHYLISHLFTHSEKASAHNLLSLLSRTLHTLTHTQNLLTILHNTTISTKLTLTTTKPSRPPPQPPTLQSIFTSTTQKPSLGRIFDDFLDLHIMISKLPKTREDAEVLYGQDERFGDGDVGYCFVFEVLRDECPVLGEDRAVGRVFGDREGRWGAFELGEEGTELRDAVVVGGGMVVG